HSSFICRLHTATTTIYTLSLHDALPIYNATPRLVLRGGYYFDESPVQSGYFAPETPRNDSNNFTGGFSFKLSDRFTIDASFLYIHFDEVEESYDHYQENGQNISFGGLYKNNGFVPGLGITYGF